ncbi:TonB-dependent receptor [Undibacterium sp. TS12]|uniref:TonB-dependent receptor n=1 Tax=Undibacterium sp. TS12 TaxID=2908202 RepID=UPI001F4CBCE6|nr:TonB-dependent receptor [Undibacterium sp. TS12]MCH8618659.1 TonB-dependent receptor [Undibacterium sp. TS12]
MLKKTVLSRSLHILFSGSLAAGLGVIATPVMAQQTENADKVQRVEITGSNIRRTEKETPSPVQVLTLQDMKASGYTDVSSVLRNITANGQGTLSQANPGSFAGGASGIALRGLTVGATLVLIDGHRMAPYALSDDGQRSFVDISQIPFDAIEKIEILKDGASSVYGSDAIAGVVNVILKKKFVGTEMSVETGTSSRRDGTTVHASGIYGWGDLDKDGHNAYLSAEYRKQNKIMVADRKADFTNTDWTSVGGINQTDGFVRRPGYQPRSSTGYLIDPNTGEISGFLPGCDAASMAAGKCTYKAPQQLQPETENINLIASYVQKLAGDWQLNLKGSLFNSKANQVNNYAGTNMNNGNGGQTQIAYGPNQLPSVNGPYFFTVPANYPGNTTGAPQWLQYNFINLGPQRTTIDADTVRLAADVTGSIGSWDVTASAGYSKNTVKQTIYNALHLANLQAALNDPKNPYRVGLAAGSNSAAQDAFIAPVASTKATDILEYVSLRGSRELMPLAGGQLSIGLGGEFTHRELNAPAPAAALDGSQLVNNSFAIGNQNVSALYMELVAPVLKNLELDAAVRYDKNAGGASATTPKLGFKYAPVNELTVRGTYAQGFRAPNPAESGKAGQSFFSNTYVDPKLCGNAGDDPTAVPGNYPAQCAVPLTGVQLPGKNLQPEKSKSYTLGLIFEPSPAFSLTTDFYKIRIDNQIISALNDPSYDPEPYIVRGTPVPQPYVLPDGTIGTKTPPIGNALYSPYPYENAQYSEVSGVDINARWTLDLKSSGKFTTDLTFTHTFKYEQGTAGAKPVRLEGTHGPSGISGNTGNPKDRAQLIGSWENGPVKVTGTVNWISSFGVTDPTNQQLLTCDDAIHGGSGAFRGVVPAQYCKVDSFTTLDLYASYKYGKNWLFHVSVQNVLDKQPPLDFQTYGSSVGTYYNPALHQAGAVGRFFNIGATYKF